MYSPIHRLVQANWVCERLNCFFDCSVFIQVFALGITFSIQSDTDEVRIWIQSSRSSIAVALSDFQSNLSNRGVLLRLGVGPSLFDNVFVRVDADLTVTFEALFEGDCACIEETDAMRMSELDKVTTNGKLHNTYLRCFLP